MQARFPPHLFAAKAMPIVSETASRLVPVGVCDVVGLGDDAALLGGLARRRHRNLLHLKPNARKGKVRLDR